MSELNHSAVQSLIHPWKQHCHWSQSRWAVCQNSHGPQTKLPHTHTHTQTFTHRWGNINPSVSPGFFAPLSALVGRTIKGSTPAWEQYLSSPECLQISLCLILTLIVSLLLTLLVCPALCPSSLHLSVYFCVFFCDLFPPFSTWIISSLPSDYLLVSLSSHCIQ